MHIIIILLIFCTVLFFYLHIFFHFKINNDLEINEISDMSKECFDEICDLRQPILFNYNIKKFLELKEENIVNKYSSFDLKIRKTNYYDSNYDVTLLPVILNKAYKLLEEENNNSYISENNSDFLDETTLVKNLSAEDDYLKPSMAISSFYDYVIGSKDSITPLRYEINYRNYIVPINGSLSIKLAPPKSIRYIHPIKDYEFFEFRSLINPWNVQDIYKNDFDKIKCLEITLQPGQALYIPSYWWYSVKFENQKSSYLFFKYRTSMNYLAILPEIMLFLLQKQNIKCNYLNKASVK